MKAKRMACEAHAGQKYGGRTYAFHLYDTALVLAEFGFSCHLAETTVEFDEFQNLGVAAFLHDIIEDTDWTYKDVRKEFGDDVADIVWAVTNEPGKNRKEKHAKTYPKIRADWRALALKLADRIANTRNCVSENPSLLGMYAKEWPAFQQAFKAASLEIPWNRKGFDRMWKHLEYLMESSKEGTE
jgi:(p)ppGpp synthase/HD superfamily hydrolase